MGKKNHQQQAAATIEPATASAPEPVTPVESTSPIEGGSVEDGLALANSVPVEPCLGCGDPKPINESCPRCHAENPQAGGVLELATAAESDAAPGLEAATEDGRGVMVECPLKRTGAYATGNISYLPRWAAQELRDLADGLAEQGMRLESGKTVNDARDAVIWFAEQLKRGRAR